MFLPCNCDILKGILTQSEHNNDVMRGFNVCHFAMSQKDVRVMLLWHHVLFWERD